MRWSRCSKERAILMMEQKISVGRGSMVVRGRGETSNVGDGQIKYK